MRPATPAQMDTGSIIDSGSTHTKRGPDVHSHSLKRPMIGVKWSTWLATKTNAQTTNVILDEVLDTVKERYIHKGLACS